MGRELPIETVTSPALQVCWVDTSQEGKKTNVRAVFLQENCPGMVKASFPLQLLLRDKTPIILI